MGPRFVGMTATLPAAPPSIEEDVALLLEVGLAPMLAAMAARVREIKAKRLSEKMKAVSQYRDGRLIQVERIRPERPVWVRER